MVKLDYIVKNVTPIIIDILMCIYQFILLTVKLIPSITIVFYGIIPKNSWVWRLIKSYRERLFKVHYCFIHLSCSKANICLKCNWKFVLNITFVLPFPFPLYLLDDFQIHNLFSLYLYWFIEFYMVIIIYAIQLKQILCDLHYIINNMRVILFFLSKTN